MKTFASPFSSLAIALALFTAGLFSVVAVAQDGDRLVELEVYSTSATPMTMQHQWLEALSQVNADRVTSKTSRTPKPGVEETTYQGTTVILVKGVIYDRKIKLPGKSFSINDKTGISNYLKSLKADGAKTTLAEKKAFGLTSEQLVDVHSKLSGTIDSSTKNEQSGALLTKLLGSQTLPTEMSAEARAALASEKKVDNEYLGMTIGTAVSIELRRHGLVLKPTPKQGRGVELGIVPIASAPESWPQGWPSESVPVATVPKLFEVTALQLNNIQLDSVLSAIQRRLKIEFVIDPAAWGGKPVDLSTVKVTYNKARSSYSAALGNILSQSKPQMRYEIRVDENGKPFIWIVKM